MVSGICCQSVNGSTGAPFCSTRLVNKRRAGLLNAWTGQVYDTRDVASWWDA